MMPHVVQVKQAVVIQKDPFTASMKGIIINALQDLTEKINATAPKLIVGVQRKNDIRRINQC